MIIGFICPFYLCKVTKKILLLKEVGIAIRKRGNLSKKRTVIAKAQACGNLLNSAVKQIITLLLVAHNNAQIDETITQPAAAHNIKLHNKNI